MKQTFSFSFLFIHYDKQPDLAHGQTVCVCMSSIYNAKPGCILNLYLSPQHPSPLLTNYFPWQGQPLWASLDTVAQPATVLRTGHLIIDAAKILHR